MYLNYCLDKIYLEQIFKAASLLGQNYLENLTILPYSLSDERSVNRILVNKDNVGGSILASKSNMRYM